MYFTVVSFFGKQGKQKREGKVELFRASGSCISFAFCVNKTRQGQWW